MQIFVSKSHFSESMTVTHQDLSEHTKQTDCLRQLTPNCIQSKWPLNQVQFCVAETVWHLWRHVFNPDGVFAHDKSPVWSFCHTVSHNWTAMMENKSFYLSHNNCAKTVLFKPPPFFRPHARMGSKFSFLLFPKVSWASLLVVVEWPARLV